MTPEVPEVPAGPVTPDVPEVPAGPVTPDVPEVPEVPAGPVAPVTPEVPEVPAGPVTPEVPEVPAGPVTPDVPEVPEVPEDPEVPEVPVPPGIVTVTLPPDPVTVTFGPTNIIPVIPTEFTAGLDIVSSKTKISEPPPDPVPPVIFTVAIPPEEETETPSPVKFIPVAPETTKVPSSKMLTGSIAAPQIKYGRSFHGFIPSPILRQSASVS